MGTQLSLGVIVVALFATTVANAEIKVNCEKDSISITWRIHPMLVPFAARHFLGNCMASRFNVLPSGEGNAEFNYKLDDCNFKRLMKGKKLLYKNELTFRPDQGRVLHLMCIPSSVLIQDLRGGFLLS
ncbi:hypothetical protein CesoFtcFv8_014717 [Champsocephalus esox]|uniref:ZP domain-containing protein n=1 Tax=Champsocephalus esox TaxID=159716 RepID=A0AAN8BR37_9TELE|nr:hypothetical protein CesoFtcFv8_014717 [Champsocephalus esox]